MKETRPRKDTEHAFTCQVCWNHVPTVNKIGRCDFCEDQWTRILSAYNKLIAVFPEFKNGTIAESYERLVFRALKAANATAKPAIKPLVKPLGEVKF